MVQDVTPSGTGFAIANILTDARYEQIDRKARVAGTFRPYLPA
jgi:hypothetical protein